MPNQAPPNLDNLPALDSCLQQNPININHTVRPPSSLHYDAYYDDGYDSFGDEITTSDLMSVQAGTDWRNLEHVYYQAVYGLDLSDVPKYQVNELRVYCNSVSTNLQRGNTNFNKD